MVLSKRLKTIVELVDSNSRVIDVGCDHAYLDIYLTLNKTNMCIATDINENALNIAKKNIEKYNLTNSIVVKKTDGLNDINVLNDDNIVISGMGTHTILNILKNNKLSDTLILSSNNDHDILRREVINLGYYISDEKFIFDKNKPYVIIKFKKGKKKYKNDDIFFGPILKYNVLYLNHLEKKYKKIYYSVTKIKLKLYYKFIIFKIYLLKRKKA